MADSQTDPTINRSASADALQSLDLPSGYRAAYRDFGSGQPIIMLHGFMGNHRNWLGLMQQLRSSYRCIAIDLLGFGESSKPDITFSVAVEVAFVRNVISSLGLSNYYLMGHSFGGWVSAAYAVRYQAEMAGLMLAAPAGIRDDSFVGRYWALRPLLWNTPVVDRALAIARPIATAMGKADNLKHIRWMRQELMAQPVARQFLTQRLRPEDAVDTVETDIPQLTLPTLVLAGDRDETIPLWHSQTYADRITTARIHVLPDAAHNLPTEHWRELTPIVQEFLHQ